MKFNHTLSNEQKALYARQWREARKGYIPQICVASGCKAMEFRRKHCPEHYEILRNHCDKRLYNIWLNMRARCGNPKNPSYKNYGGRGIGHVPSWVYFINFYEDMHATYRSDLTLDRVNNSKGYSKKNCRWATQEEQQNNRRDNVWITYNGVRLTLSQWVRKQGLNKRLVASRIYISKWPYLKALELEKA